MAEKIQNNPLIDKLFSVGAHFGYGKSRRHPSTSRFLFGTKGNVELFDLERTVVHMEEALAFVRKLAADRQVLLFVGSKAEGRGALERAARRVNQPYVASRWIGGTLTNWSEIKKRLGRLTELSDMREQGLLGKFTKLERLLIDREIADLEAMFGGLRGMEKLPAALFVIDPRHEKTAVTEAKRLGLPIVALLNTDCDAGVVTYPIPGNDASRHTIEFVLDEVAKAFEQEASSASLPAEPTQQG